MSHMWVRLLFPVAISVWKNFTDTVLPPWLLYTWWCDKVLEPSGLCKTGIFFSLVIFGLLCNLYPRWVNSLLVCLSVCLGRLLRVQQWAQEIHVEARSVTRSDRLVAAYWRNVPWKEKLPGSLGRGNSEVKAWKREGAFVFKPTVNSLAAESAQSWSH